MPMSCCLEQDFEPGSSHVYLKIVTEGLKRSFYINGTVVGVLDHVIPFVQRVKKRKTLYRSNDRSV